MKERGDYGFNVLFVLFGQKLVEEGFFRSAREYNHIINTKREGKRLKDKTALIIGGSIIIGFTIFGLLLMAALEEFVYSMDEFDVGRDLEYNEDTAYEIIPVGDNNIILFDKDTGSYWTKYVPSGEGPTNWEKGDYPAELDE